MSDSKSSAAVVVAVVGAGAAGLMAAITARTHSEKSRVLLFDGRQKVGAKILISGGTRCNVTHEKVSFTDYCGGAGHFVRHVLQAYTPAHTVDFFKSIGVELVLEPSGKLFPTTHSGRTVLEALLAEVDRVGVEKCFGSPITVVSKKNEEFFLESENAEIWRADRVIVATGGLSLPETGSRGAGYQIAKHFGHSIIQTYPSLTPFETGDEDWKKLSGISLPVKLSYYARGKKKAESKGSFLFTHFGYSGPAVLDLSRHYSTATDDDHGQVKADFIPEAQDEQIFDWLSDFSRHKSLKNVLADLFLFPERFVDCFLKKIGADGLLPLGRVRHRDMQKILHELRHTDLNVSGTLGYKKAEVTAGGVDLKEVRHATLESRKTKGLYFAGEILDADGRIGGFNFQWAWSSGFVAGKSSVSQANP